MVLWLTLLIEFAALIGLPVMLTAGYLRLNRPGR